MLAESWRQVSFVLRSSSSGCIFNCFSPSHFEFHDTFIEMRKK